jgi:hypothetical protein
MSKFVVGASSDKIYQALHDAGVFADDPDFVRRVVIDLEAGSPAKFYIELFGDDRLTEVLLEAGIRLVES